MEPDPSGEIAVTKRPGEPATIRLRGLDDIAGAAAWLAAAKGELKRLLRLHGVVYLRGLPMSDVDGFARLRDVILDEPTAYREKATPRSHLGHDVYSSTDMPPAHSIRMHNENSYTLTFPGTLIFGCLVAPDDGGATPTADCREVLRAVPEPLARRMRESGWTLIRNYSENLSLDWRVSFHTTERSDVEKYCAENLITCAWNADGSLRTRQSRPGIIHHPVSGEEVWFNHLAFWNAWSLDDDIREVMVDEYGWGGLPFQTGIGDGRILARSEIDEVNRAYEAATVRHRWQPGDLMIVDNILASHGRDPYRGDRKIVVAMGDPVELKDCRPATEPFAPSR